MSEVLEAQEQHKEAAANDEAQPPRLDLRKEVTLKIIEAMESGNTPWQKPWSAPPMRPVNGVSNNSYRGLNRLLLTLAGQEFGDPRWVTYQQAAAKGWNVKRGAKGHMVIKLLEFPQGEGQAHGAGESSQESEATQGASGSTGKRFGLKRYWVFNAEQVQGMPALEGVQTHPEFDPVQRAENVMLALKEKTGLLILHGGNCHFSPHTVHLVFGT